MACSHPAWLPNCSAWPHLSPEADGDPEGPALVHQLVMDSPGFISTRLSPVRKIVQGFYAATGTRRHCTLLGLLAVLGVGGCRM